MLPDAAGEDERVEPGQGGGCGRDALCRTLTNISMASAARASPSAARRSDLAMSAVPADRQQPGAMIEDVGQSLDVEAFRSEQMQQ